MKSLHSIMFVLIAFCFQQVVPDNSVSWDAAEEKNENMRAKRAPTEAACHAVGLSLAEGNEVKAATEMIRYWTTSGAIPGGTRVSTIIAGRNIDEYKATANKRGFAEFIDSARIDNQGVISVDGVLYNNLQLQLKNKPPYAIVLLKVGVNKSASEMRNAFYSSMNECIKVKLT